MLRSGLHEQIISQSRSRELASVPNQMTALTETFKRLLWRQRRQRLIIPLPDFLRKGGRRAETQC